ncbi:MAG TPA: family 65 glycosyl hydrolase domain-containing protein [Paludibacter sp.]|nr:family 65 glycosyl hydrolase domain-containing protein [Paludibacter sp.]
MNKYLQYDPWSIIEEGFQENKQLASESIFSIGNGQIGQRANFEEFYSGETQLGSYIGGIYFPENIANLNKKIGYSSNSEKIINAPNWSVINVRLNDEKLDLATWDVKNFRRVLNMREGILERTFEATSFKGHRIQVNVKRFLSMAETEVGAISFTIKSLNFEGRISFQPLIDGEIINQNTIYNETFWNILQTKTEQDVSFLWAQTRKKDFHFCAALSYVLYKNNELLNINPTKIEKEKVAGFSVGTDVKIGETVCLNKYIAITSSLKHSREELTEYACNLSLASQKKGWNQLFGEHTAVWHKIWSEMDIMIDSDLAAQQAIRYNIFQLIQTYNGNDEKQNINPGVFSGEKLNGLTRWDTEAVCIPFYLGNLNQNTARNLLTFRFKHLSKAIQNAAILGFENGAALFPAATFNGKESINEWEKSFGEIHRNGLIAYSIFDYIRYTGDENYLVECGLQELIAIARFWKQRVNFSEEKNQFVICGVAGPNNYECNVNNNWFTNHIAVWTLKFTIECIEKVKKLDNEKFEALMHEINFSDDETFAWKNIAENMYFPVNNNNGTILQQDGFLDKFKIKASEIPESQLPVSMHWTRDRILRSSLIKQPDVLLGMFLFEDNFDKETISRNYDYYEPFTVHESAISYGIHSLIASRIGKEQNAMELFLKSCRYDLDDLSCDVAEGLHVTGMAASWMAVVHGFGGMQIKNDQLYFTPRIPVEWNAFSFTIHFRLNVLNFHFEKEKAIVQNVKGSDIFVNINNKPFNILSGNLLEIKL